MIGDLKMEFPNNGPTRVIIITGKEYQKLIDAGFFKRRNQYVIASIRLDNGQIAYQVKGNWSERIWAEFLMTI